MLDDLLPYYEKELSHLRFLGQEFAQQYPKIASRLLIDGDHCEDPHTERLIEAFSFLAARVHKKLDDEFPEIVEAFLEILYPHYLRPTPSMSIVQLGLSEQAKVTEGFRVARHTELKSLPVEGVACKFRTCYPVDLWPVEVRAASFVELERSAFNGHSSDLVARLRLTLAATTAQDCIGEAGMDSLRFFLDGESTLMLQLYELLFNNLAKVTLGFEYEACSHEVALPVGAIKAVGYSEEEGLVDYSERSFLGYRLLHEYFTFPDKFMFFDLRGLAGPLKGKGLGSVEVNLYFSNYELGDRLARLAQTLGRGNFKLNCVPVINLFQQQAEPILLTHAQHEYPVIPKVGQQRQLEVVSIDEVKRVDGADQVSLCRAFFDPRGSSIEDEACYWIGRRRQATAQRDNATHMFIRVVDRHLELVDSVNGKLSLTVTCSNRDLPQQLPFGGERSEFSMPSQTVVSSIRCLRKPTAAARVPLNGGLLWRLVSHLTLNHLSLVANGRDVLLELLSLYNYRNTLAIRKQINGITKIKSEPTVARIGHPRPSFVRGVGITLEIDESQFAGSGVFLFGMMLEHFFGQYCTVNSFTQLSLRSVQREQRIAQWPPRSGALPLV
jgi:type VI secretion system protein ImpG